MTHSTVALTPHALGASIELASLTDEEMLAVAGGAILPVIAIGCAFAGAAIAVCVVAAVIGAAVYIATH